MVDGMPTSTPTREATPLSPRPGTARARATWLWPAVFWAGAGAVLAPWALNSASEFTTDPVTGIGRVAGLLAGYLIAVQLILMSRLVDGHRVPAWHRRIGGAVFAFLMAHMVFITVGYAAGGSVVDQTVGFIESYPWLLAAYAGTALLVMIGLTSIRAVKRRMKYETWYYVHLYAYLGAALAFAHTITVSADITGVARLLWVALYGAALALAVWGRIVRPLRLTLRHGFRVSHVVPETADVTSVHIGARRMRGFPAKPGQFFRFRFLTRDGWWQAHPFSLSAAPGPHGLRVTVKALGDHTRALRDLPVGTRVLVEGPYGDFTADSRVNDKVLMIAAGIGITPIRALLEEMPSGTVVLYRARSEQEIVLREELDELASLRGAHVLYVLGGHRDPNALAAFTSSGLKRLVPDIETRDVFLCGPPGLVQHLRGELRKAGVHDRHVHLDPFEL